MKPAKILIVDDRPENLLTLEGLLDDHHVEPVRALSGEEALAATLDHDFALVLLDVQMPGMDGYEVAELMRGNKKTRHIPIIFVTATLNAEAQVFRGYESGAVDYLAKPFNPMVLNSKVGVFIELFQHKAALEEKTIEFNQKLVELEELQQQLEETNEQLLLLSATDSLTGLYNRRRFDELCGEEWNRCQRNNHPLSMLILDIDYFKVYNDTYGHSAGDECLKAVATTLTNSLLRDIDNIARIGGEEFAVILPNADLEGARLVAERIRTAVASLELKQSASTGLTISIGVASMIPSDENSITQLLSAADTALYTAKNQGRNRCCLAAN